MIYLFDFIFFYNKNHDFVNKKYYPLLFILASLIYKVYFLYILYLSYMEIKLCIFYYFFPLFIGYQFFKRHLVPKYMKHFNLCFCVLEILIGYLLFVKIGFNLESNNINRRNGEFLIKKVIIWDLE